MGATGNAFTSKGNFTGVSVCITTSCLRRNDWPFSTLRSLAHPVKATAIHRLNHTILKGLHQLIILQRNFAHKSVFPIHTSKKSSVEKGYQMGALTAAEEVSQ
jgi:hypothetical protein